MGYNELEIELRKLIALVERWRQQGCVPTIEQGIALGRLQRLYAEVMEMPTEDIELPVVEESVVQESVIDDSVDQEAVVDDLVDEETVEEEPVIEMDESEMESTPVEMEPEKEPDQQLSKESSKEGKPAILGVAVSHFARQEIVQNLFHGNIPLFEHEIKKFEAMQSLDEALVYIGETYHWVPEEAATIKFIDILESRFRE